MPASTPASVPASIAPASGTTIVASGSPPPPSHPRRHTAANAAVQAIAFISALPARRAADVSEIQDARPWQTGSFGAQARDPRGRSAPDDDPVHSEALELAEVVGLEHVADAHDRLT